MMWLVMDQITEENMLEKFEQPAQKVADLPLLENFLTKDLMEMPTDIGVDWILWNE